MKCMIQEQIYEEKMDKISEYLEELILGSILTVLRKIKERNMLLNELSKKNEIDDDLF